MDLKFKILFLENRQSVNVYCMGPHIDLRGINVVNSHKKKEKVPPVILIKHLNVSNEVNIYAGEHLKYSCSRAGIKGVCISCG